MEDVAYSQVSTYNTLREFESRTLLRETDRRLFRHISLLQTIIISTRFFFFFAARSRPCDLFFAKYTYVYNHRLAAHHPHSRVPSWTQYYYLRPSAVNGRRSRAPATSRRDGRRGGDGPHRPAGGRANARARAADRRRPAGTSDGRRFDHRVVLLLLRRGRRLAGRPACGLPPRKPFSKSAASRTTHPPTAPKTTGTKKKKIKANLNKMGSAAIWSALSFRQQLW